MAMYGVVILPLVDMLNGQNLTRKSYSDNNNMAGCLRSLIIVLDKLNEYGGEFGYNVIKCDLDTKLEFVQKVNKIFF